MMIAAHASTTWATKQTTRYSVAPCLAIQNTISPNFIFIAATTKLYPHEHAQPPNNPLELTGAGLDY